MEQGEKRSKSNWDSWWAGLLIGCVVIAIVSIAVTFFSGKVNNDYCRQVTETISKHSVRVMLHESLGSQVCKYATDKGLVLLHDDIIFVESEYK